MAIGLMGIFIILFSSMSRPDSDIVSYLSPEDYFQSRKVPLTVPSMIELAGKDPIDGKTQIQQLLALRYLGENPAKVKQADGFKQHLQMIEAVARGTKGKDRFGFAREYAMLACNKIGETPAFELPAHARKSLKLSALEWFPDNLTFAAALDFGARANANAKAGKGIRDFNARIFEFMPAKAKDEVYAHIEKIGNIRIGRVAVGYVETADGKSGQVFVRVSGKVDHDRVLKVVRENKLLEIDTSKGPRNEPIALTDNKTNAAALVGDEELIVAIRVDGEADQTALIKQMLKVRSGAAKPAAPLADDIKQISDKSNGFVTGSLPKHIAGALANNGAFTALPRTFTVEMQSKGDDLLLNLKATMANAADATSFSGSVTRLRAQGLEALKKAPPLPKELPISLDNVKKSVESIRVQATGPNVTGSILMTPDLLPALLIPVNRSSRD